MGRASASGYRDADEARCLRGITQLSQPQFRLYSSVSDCSSSWGVGMAMRKGGRAHVPQEPLPIIVIVRIREVLHIPKKVKPNQSDHSGKVKHVYYYCDEISTL